MKVTYDRVADAMTIALADADVRETKSIAPGFFADYDADGRVIALEILKAGQKYDLNQTEIQPPDPYMSLSEAGEMFGLSPANLRLYIAKGSLEGKKFGDNWMVRHDHMTAYIRERSEKPAKSKIKK